MSFIGGQLDQLTALKSSFEQQSGLVQELTSTLRGQLANTYWQGPNADRFRETWTAEYEPVLRQLEQTLLDAGREIAVAADRLLQAGG